MKNKLAFVLSMVIVLNATILNSQNLVPNPSFETLSQCPWGNTQIFFATPWFQPCIHSGNPTNSSSSEIFNACDSNGFVGVPVNAAGYGFQNTHSGNGYAGIYGGMDSTNNGREYIEAPLQSPLIANKKYCIEFYVSLANFSQYAISNMGAYLSVGSLLDTSYYQGLEYMVSPQIENPNGNYLNDTLNWMLVSGNFIASGGEDHITIGNFRNPLHTNVQNLSWGIDPASYYYVDDVSLVDCTGVGVEEKGMGNVEIMPNPATNEIMLTTNQPIKTIHIYNVLGEEVLKLERIATNEKAIDVSTWKAGVYFVEVETEKGVIRKKVVKE